MKSIQKRHNATVNMTNMEDVQKNRLDRVQAVCEKYNNLRSGYSPRTNSQSFIFDVKNGFAWCRILKVFRNIVKLSSVIAYISQSGSSTWFGHLKRLTGLSDKCLKDLHDPHRNGTRISVHRKIRNLLLVDGQDRPDFSVNKFAAMHDLLTFTFVRHPFERWARNDYSNQLQGPLFM